MKTISVGTAMDMMALWPALVNTLAVLATVAVVSTGATRWMLVAPLVPLAIIVWRQRRTVLRVPRGVGGLGRYLTARFILIAAAGAQLFVASEFQALETVAFVLAVVALAAEPVVRSANGIAVPYASNFPDHEPRNRAVFPYGWMFPLNLLGLLALVLTGLAAVPLLAVAVTLSSVSIVLALLAFSDIGRRIQTRRRFQENLDERLKEIGPGFYLYWNAPPRSAFQVTMWLPYLERLGVPFALVVRTVPNFRQLEAATEHPVLLRRSIADLDALIVPSVRGVFYANNAMRNNHMVRYSSLTHIQLLHGESDKPASATPIIRMYDRDFVAGQAAIDRFDKFGVSMHRDIFRIVGRPQVEAVEEERGPIGMLEEQSVLYAPTWLGLQAETNYSSLLAGPEIVRGLIDRGCRVIFRPHPYSRQDRGLRQACAEIQRLLETDTESTRHEHLHGDIAEQEMSVMDCFNVADAMISDVSGMVGDFLHSGKPLAMVSPRTGAREFVEEFPMARAAYVLEVVGSSPVNLQATLDALMKTDPHREERQRWATYYLGNIPRENYVERFVQTARKELGLDC
ncbi:CDP-glycerol glycerophosphotransferase family protein [Brachybacterium alimentarium]|uniref:CDP-glycerol glycerophosphotransferase family protein n=1 Tax=Brachybacterium alimentarium TaxID=47845 RepID=UPI00216195D5|nr:CDP-glycerol glycerophosphotransferase family protein [Brachybacterium alimentarium]